MELLSIALAANETKQFAKAGRYFELIQCDYPIRVDFTGANGAISDNMVGAISGLFLEDPYSHFAIANGANAQTVVVLVMETGRGGSRRQPGVVSVTNKIGAAVMQVEISTAPMLNPGFLATQLLDPTTNYRGFLVRRVAANAAAGASGTFLLRIVAAPVIPTVQIPLNAYQLAATAGAASTSGLDAHSDQNYQLPAGWGVWAVTAHTGAGASGISAALAYELL